MWELAQTVVLWTERDIAIYVYFGVSAVKWWNKMRNANRYQWCELFIDLINDLYKRC